MTDVRNNLDLECAVELYETTTTIEAEATPNSNESMADPLGAEDEFQVKGKVSPLQMAFFGVRMFPLLSLLSLSGCGGSEFPPFQENEDYSSSPDDDTDTDTDTAIEVDPYDQDGDGYLNCESTSEDDCDCDDLNPTVNPGVEEIDLNGIDDDCNGMIDVPEEDDVSPPDGDGEDDERYTFCDDSSVYGAYSMFSETQYVPISLHVLRNDTGSGGMSDMASFDSALELANQYFDDLNVEFFVDSDSEIHSSNYLDLEDKTERYALLDAGYSSEGSINIYIVDSYKTVSGASTFPHYSSQGIVVIDTALGNTRSTLTHELGHYFNLMHTHQGYGDELVDGSNCDVSGDFICDTPADPAKITSNSDEGCYYDEESCSITSCGNDANGDEYEPNIGDVMSYYPDSCNDDSFSVSQEQMMVCVMQNIRTELDFTSEPPAIEDSVGCDMSIYSTIQGAIDGVDDGTTIEICDGTYQENLSIENQSVTISAKSGHNSVTIDGGTSGRAVSILNDGSDSTNRTVKLSGLDITNGRTLAGSSVQFWSASSAHYATLEMEDCNVSMSEVTSSTSYGNIYATLGSAGGSVILESVNLYSGVESGAGALSIVSTDSSNNTTVELTDVIVTNNNGGGVWLEKIQTVDMTSLNASSNAGVGLFLNNIDTTVIDGLSISNNTGGGVGISEGENVHISNAVVESNTLTHARSGCGYIYSWGAGVGIYEQPSVDALSVTIQDSTISDNNASACTVGADNIAGGLYIYAGSLTLDNTVVNSNQAPSGSNAGGVGLADWATFLSISSDYGTSSASNNSPYDVVPHEYSTYNYGNNESFSCNGGGGTCN